MKLRARSTKSFAPEVSTQQLSKSLSLILAEAPYYHPEAISLNAAADGTRTQSLFDTSSYVV